MERGKTRYVDGVLSRKTASRYVERGKRYKNSLSLDIVLFFVTKVTASGRMSRQYVYNRSFCGILNNKFSQ